MWRVKKKDKSIVKLSTKQKLQNDRSLLCITPCLTAARQFNYQNLTVKFRLLLDAFSSSWQTSVPDSFLFLADSCSLQAPVPGRLIFLEYSCSRRLKFLANSYSWQNYNRIADSCSSPIHVPCRLIAYSDSRPRLMFLKEFCPSSLLFLTDSCSCTVADFCSYSRLLFLRSWQISFLADSYVVRLVILADSCSWQLLFSASFLHYLSMFLFLPFTIKFRNPDISPFCLCSFFSFI